MLNFCYFLTNPFQLKKKVLDLPISITVPVGTEFSKVSTISGFVPHTLFLFLFTALPKFGHFYNASIAFNSSLMARVI
ncbi:hypothetical protein SUGI_0098840 [Cryptomeria japonica]|nr:hypothetical protein SUGI_0098840 [Cryptomeria japonica]